MVLRLKDLKVMVQVVVELVMGMMVMTVVMIVMDEVVKRIETVEIVVGMV